MFKLTAAEAIELQAYLSTMESNIRTYRLANIQDNYKMVGAMEQIMTPTATLKALTERITAELETKIADRQGLGWVFAAVDLESFLTEDLRFTADINEAKRFASKAEAETWYWNLEVKPRIVVRTIETAHVPT